MTHSANDSDKVVLNMSNNAPEQVCVVKGFNDVQRCKQCNRGVHSPWCEVETPTKTHLGVSNRSSCIFCSQVYINNTKTDILHQVFILEKINIKFCLREANLCHDSVLGSRQHAVIFL